MLLMRKLRRMEVESPAEVTRPRGSGVEPRAWAPPSPGTTLPALTNCSFLPDQAHQAPEDQAGQTRGKAQGIRATVPRSPEAGEGKPPVGGPAPSWRQHRAGHLTFRCLSGLTRGAGTRGSCEGAHDTKHSRQCQAQSKHLKGL